MEIANELARTIELTEMLKMADEVAKKLLSNKIVLAWIAKTCVAELAAYSVQKIASEYILDHPFVSAGCVRRRKKL